MAKMKGNYTMGQAMDYCKRGKISLKVIGVLGAFFPFFPPYFLGFDPRFEEQVPIFYLYLGIYYILFIGILGRMADQQSKLGKIVAEKAILMGCPIEIKPMGGKASNSYRTTVMVNEAMLAQLRELKLEGHNEMQGAEKSLAEPFVEKFSIGSGTSAKFLAKNIPHFEKARKIGDIPDVPT